MNNHYFIDEPAAISFSGGRTSAYMLWKVLEAHGGVMPDQVKVLFANTGKELEATYDFVRDCGENWGVEIVWLELAKIENTAEAGERSKFHREHRIVTHETASRNGEPFKILLDAFDAIPNAVARTCTVNLKIRTMKSYLISVGYESPWLQLIGIRADEVRRARKIHHNIEEGHETVCPLFEDGVTKEMIGEFWRNQPFDLALPNHNGVTAWGNCDLCFLKSRKKRLSIIRERPELADWWIEAEENKQQKFRADGPSYRQMKAIATDQPSLFDFEDDDSIPCFCGD